MYAHVRKRFAQGSGGGSANSCPTSPMVARCLSLGARRVLLLERGSFDVLMSWRCFRIAMLWRALLGIGMHKRPS